MSNTRFIHNKKSPKINKSYELAKTRVIKGKADSLMSATPIWLALLQDFRTMDWTEVYKYPTVMLQQMQQLVGTTDQK